MTADRVSRLRVLPAEVATREHTAVLAGGWDWPIAGCDTLDSYVDLALTSSRRRFVWVLQGDEPVGFLGVVRNDSERRFETSTYLAPERRGTGLNRVLKHSLAAAFQTLGLPLVAVVRARNHRSLAAMRRLCSYPGSPAIAPDGTARLVFDLSGLDAHAADPRIRSSFIDFAPELRAMASRRACALLPA
ncbi:GNAT family N-acetyltransferase [Salinibacterium sp. SYSU T00001]|uniref:GNAT family N-acetyltransferase n=1 Tax=Homoserinimonas sedimenticola TaxID=2986805 RepID=UPI002235C4C6|nr:GNAT family N-acetyltransferase [Salinibacterium sedimenticola]MCW4386187.1 GNAT family N-acetyltransferase [Salinibacterium sedimenticola]